MRWLWSALGAGAALASSAGAQPRVPPVPPRVEEMLQAYGGLSASQRAAIARGDAAVGELATTDKYEVAFVGVLHVAAPRTAYAQHARDGRALFGPGAPIAEGVFGTPATDADVARLTLDREDVAALRDCRPLHCPLKLPAAQMARLGGAVDGSRAPGPQVDAFLRRWLVQLVTDYRASGDAALPVYDDTQVGERSASGFAALLAESGAFLRDAPGLASHLASGSAPPPRVASTVYWVQDAPRGLPPILRVVERAVYVSPARPAETLVADKLLYADHYFDAMLDLSTTVDAPADADGIFLVQLRRMRFDGLPTRGVFSMRGRIVRRLRDAFRESLLRTGRELEEAHGAGGAPPAR